ncbi:MAG: hypothetical protein HW377_443 [Actinobacteria bacterium]|nr:hypothetical protein [Actinomycetota bacterium]
MAPPGSCPESRKPTTSGISMETGWPSIAASASMPPTPQPTTPSPLIIGVCESVPRSVSGYAWKTPRAFLRKTTWARYSRFTWWQMPVPGGTTRRFRKAFCPQRRKAYRSPLRSYSLATLAAKDSRVPKWSTWTEWSMTRSAGMRGLIPFGSPPIRSAASRMAARSTSAGTPVKSCSSTRAGRKAISRSDVFRGDHRARALMSSARTVAPSSHRSRFSSRILIEKGSRETDPLTRFSSASRRKISQGTEPIVLRALAPKLSGCFPSMAGAPDKSAV